MTFPFALVRGLHMLGLMGILGSAWLQQRLARLMPELALDDSLLRRIRLVLAVLVLITGPLWLALAAAQMAGDSAAGTDPAALGAVLLQTRFGAMLAARMGLVLLILIALALRREAMTGLLSAAALATISVTSHAAAASRPGFAVLGIATDALHLWCGGIWLGGLVVLAALIRRRPQAPRLTEAVSLFADQAVIAVALLLLTGLINAATIILGGEGHASRLYLGVLGAKLVLVAAMLALALTNHFRLLPRLAQPSAQGALKGNIAWELGLGMAAVLLASLLGLLAPSI